MGAGLARARTEAAVAERMAAVAEQKLAVAERKLADQLLAAEQKLADQLLAAERLVTWEGQVRKEASASAQRQAAGDEAEAARRREAPSEVWVALDARRSPP